MQFTASVTGLGTGVTWTVASGGGTINASGLYTAPATGGNATVRATSIADPTKSATASITIVAPVLIEVIVTPSSATVEVSQVVQFDAIITGTVIQDVTWQVVSGGGSITNAGVYTAPAVTGPVVIQATSVADPSKSATANITVVHPVSISISPETATIQVTETLQFSATVTGFTNTAVTWAITSGEGSISPTGLYTAPATGGHAIVEVTSVANPLESAFADITIIEPIAVSISPPNAVVEVSQIVQFTAQVAGTTDTAVIWTLDSGGGSIDSNGFYTAPPTGGTSTIRATSVADPTKSATAGIIIQEVSIAVSPSDVNVGTSGTVQFTATVGGTTNTAVSWDIVSGGGTISAAGLYTAPAVAGAAVVRATSQADPSQSATANVTISDTVAVSVAPPTVTLEVSQTQLFVATVTGSANTDVTWDVISGGGSIDGAGLYTAPNTGGSATVRATSVADNTKFATATVTIQDVTVDVAPSDASVLVNGTQQFAATVGGTTNTAVSWDIVSGGGTIDAAGLYTAPAVPGAAVVRATSQADPSQSATAGVAISDTVAVSVNPTSANLQVSQTQLFVATVTGSANTGVTWDVISGGGSIDAAGLYTAPSTGGSATVRATSVADNTKFATATVTIQDVTVDVAPSHGGRHDEHRGLMGHRKRRGLNRRGRPVHGAGCAGGGGGARHQPGRPHGKCHGQCDHQSADHRECGSQCGDPGRFPDPVVRGHGERLGQH
jgi:hypothetical protein